MLIKAGTYTFNNELTIDKEFSQNINIVLSASEADSSGELHCSRIWTADNNNMLVVNLYKMVIRENGEEIVEEIEEPQPFPIYYKGSFVGDIPISQTHTITDDTDVSNTFAAWYIANTDYVEVNGGEVPDIPEEPDEPEEPDIPEPVTISFSINRNGTVYNLGAEEGMTWREWVSSDYNNTALQLMAGTPDYLVFSVGNRDILDVNVDDVIVDGQTYYSVVKEEPEPEPEPEPRKILFTMVAEVGHTWTGDTLQGTTWREWVADQNANHVKIVSGDPDYLMFALYEGSDWGDWEWQLNVDLDEEIKEYMTYYLVRILTPPQRQFVRLYDGVITYKSGDKKFKRMQPAQLAYTLNDDGTQYTCNGMGAHQQKNIEILGNLGGIPVTKIDTYAFNNCSVPERITIPNSITYIANAFNGCVSLKNITIPSSVTTITTSFKNCVSLENIYVDDNNPQYYSLDGNLYSRGEDVLVAYAKGKKSASFTVPDIVTDIKPGAFSGCQHLTHIAITGGNMTRLFGLTGCTSLEIATINNVERVAENAFLNCRRLRKVHISQYVTNIEANAFGDCLSIVEFVVDENNPVYESVDGTLYTKTDKYNRRYLWEYARGKQDSSFTIPDFVTHIRKYAFKWSLGLKSITIPTSVTYIGEYAFRYCENIKDVNYAGTVEQWNAISLGENWNLNVPATYVHCIDGKVLLKHSEGLAFTSNGDGTCYVSGIGNCTGTDIVIPSVSPEGDRVTSIGEWAFRGRTSLTSITIPNSVTSFGEGAFAHCTSLTSIEIPDSVTWTGNHTFAFCTSLKSVVIPNSVTAIGYNAFDTCSSLTSVTIPNSITTIYEQAFKWCTLLTDIIFEGTISQWRGITLYPFWNNQVPATYVQCTDGQVPL